METQVPGSGLLPAASRLSLAVPALSRWAGFGLLLAAVSASVLHSYVLFHSLVEVLRIVVLFGIAALAWNARSQIDHPFLLVAGLAYPAVGMLELLHTLAYKGMGVFPADANLPTQLWIAFRAYESVAMLIAASLLPRRGLPVVALAAAFLLAGIGLAWLVMSGRFPDCFIEGSGLTSFKIAAEYAIAGVFVFVLVLLWSRRADFPADILPLVLLAVVFDILAELAFTQYISVYGLANMTGHLLLLTSTYLLYCALLRQGIQKPQSLLFHQLSREKELLARSEAELARRVAERTAQVTEANRRLVDELGERKRAEEAVQRLNAELERRVHERTAELETALKELEAFSFSVSHDLRTPLRAIDGFSRLLLRKYEAALDDDGKRLLHVVRDNTARMSQLIDDILSFSRAGRLELRQAAVDMQALVHEVWLETAAIAPGRDIRLDVKPLPQVRGDAALLRQVWANLLGNAVKFTGPRAVAEIEIGGSVDGGECRYYVKDNGVGFDPRYIDKLFGVFQRLHGIEEFDGTGIGLAIVKRIVARHGGRVWAEGRVDGGATLHFALPAPGGAR